ncbi:MAG TPA: cupin domain-containing protein [Planctomycetota bacterium]|nr:cupin domain-containing protein [Planctomycetota bacterium]
MAIDLHAVPFRPTRYRGVSIHFYYSDRERGHAAVMIRMEPGCSYPRHRHKGAEELLILQGGYRDETGEHRAGDFVRYEDGTSHHPVALDGEPCVFFAIAHEGIELLASDLDQA